MGKREITMTAAMLMHGLMVKNGEVSEKQIGVSLDRAEALFKQSVAREGKWRELEREADEAERARQAPEPVKAP